VSSILSQVEKAEHSIDTIMKSKSQALSEERVKKIKAIKEYTRCIPFSLQGDV